MKKTLIALMIFALSSSTAAAEQGSPAPWSFGGGVGGFSPSGGSGQLKNQSGQYALTVDANYRQSEHFAWGFSLSFYDQRLDTPAHLVAPTFSTINGRASINSTGFSGTAKWVTGSDRWESFAGGGIGLFHNEMTVTGSTFGFLGEDTRTSNDLGLLLLAGVTFRTEGNSLFGIEWRQLKMKASFGDFTTGNAEIGGSSVMLTWHKN